MAFLKLTLAMALTAIPGQALAIQEAQPAPAEAATVNGFDLARAKIDGCAGERFDFEVTDGPEAKGTKVGLCSKEGASNAEIAAMLRSAIGQLEGSDRVAAPVRDQIVTLIRAKIVEVEAR